MRRRWIAKAATVAVAAAVAVVVAVQIRLPVGDLDGRIQHSAQDPMLNVWALSWESTALVHHPSDLYDGNIYSPASTTIAYSESMLPLVPVFGLLRVVTGSDLAANALLTYGLLLGAAGGTYALARRFVERRATAVVAGLAVALGSYAMAHLVHQQLLTLAGIPLSLLALLRVLERPTWSRAIACGAVVAVSALSSLYYGVALAPMLATVAAVHLTATGQWRSRRSLAAVAFAGASAALLAAPGLVPYLQLDARQDLARPVEPAFDLGVDDVVTPVAQSSLYEALAERGERQFGGAEHALFPGFVVLALGAVGAGLVAAGRIRRRAELGALVAGAAVAVVLALGAETAGVPMPFGWLHDHVPGFDGIRATVRLAAPALVVVAVLAAVGLDALVRRARPALASVVAVGVCVVTVVELWAPQPWAAVDTSEGALAVYRALDERPAGVVVELPMGNPYSPPGQPVWMTTEPTRMVRSLIDRNPRVNGYSGHFPPGYVELAFDFNEFPAPASLRRVGELGVRYVVLHLGAAIDGRPFYDDVTATVVIAALPPGWDAERHGDAWLLAAPTG
jgi:hypothetical protein